MKNYKTILENLSSNKSEYDYLNSLDHIFILKGKFPDDNDVIDARSHLEGFEWVSKLRGPYEGPAKIANHENNQDFCHGYIFGVLDCELINFERSALIMTLTSNYVIEKLDLFNTKKEIQEEHFNNLFE